MHIEGDWTAGQANTTKTQTHKSKESIRQRIRVLRRHISGGGETMPYDVAVKFTRQQSNGTNS